MVERPLEPMFTGIACASSLLGIAARFDAISGRLCRQTSASFCPCRGRWFAGVRGLIPHRGLRSRFHPELCMSPASSANPVEPGRNRRPETRLMAYRTLCTKGTSGSQRWSKARARHGIVAPTVDSEFGIFCQPRSKWCLRIGRIQAVWQALRPRSAAWRISLGGLALSNR